MITRVYTYTLAVELQRFFGSASVCSLANDSNLAFAVPTVVALARSRQALSRLQSAAKRCLVARRNRLRLWIGISQAALLIF